MLTKYYKLRPDVFIQRAPGKLRFKRQEENFIVNLNDRFIDIVLDFFEQADGKKSLEQLLSTYNGPAQASLNRMSQFLLSKDLAFFQSDRQKIPSASLVMVENYLNQHFTDSQAAYEAFASRHFLLVASDIPLFSLVRTMADYGARHLEFVNVNKCPSITSAQILKGFQENKKAADADIREVALDDAQALARCDVLVTTDRQLYIQIDRYFQSNAGMKLPVVYLVEINADHVVVSKSLSQHELFPGAASRSRQLIAGAVAGSMIFDDLTGVRPIDSKHYLYYGLDAHGCIEKGVHVSVQGLDTLQGNSLPLFNVLEDMQSLLRQPLFPVSACCSVIHEVDHLYIQAIQIKQPMGSFPSSTTFYGIGFDQQQACRDALEHFILISKCWFSDDVQGPRLAEKHPFTATQSSSLDLTGLTLNPFSEHIDKQSGFLKFCIARIFGASVTLRQHGCDEQRILVASVGSETVFCLCPDNIPGIVQRLLLRLYLNLWLSHTQPAMARANEVVAVPLVGNRDLTNEK
ncbi:hypothetical protein [Rheinheimera sp. NSM]|uniref:hypothetical protein n=1 Tax=Rheinheimera sp. NSM TaxID=3457884 RepID=UPI00403627B9